MKNIVIFGSVSNDEGMFVNGLFSAARTSTDNFTAYINPYLVVSRGGNYTKHIYIGSQRIVSKLGDLDSYGQDPRRIAYAGSEVDGASIDFASKYKEAQQTVKDRYTDFGVEYRGEDNDDYVNGGGFCCDDSPQLRAGTNDNPELYQYYYHSDHLGSTSLITNLDGEIVQHVEYVPFGEVFIEERNNTWNTPYLFNAKELDEETGLYYYGARYYDSRISVFLGVDPMWEKYQGMSVYAYCANNPVKYIDPTGMELEADEQSQGNIRNTLTTQEAKYVKFDKNGVLDTKRLNKSKSTSENMTALKALANSEVVYNFQVAEHDHEGNAYYDNTSTGGNFYRGTTEMPDAESNPSPDNKVYVLVGKVLNEKQQVMTTAHEGFGHAYFYEITRDIEKASHIYKPEGRMIWDEELQMNAFEITKVPVNIPLENQIKTVVKQAENNYDNRKK